jgi:D-glycero-beta-D-manno-heptose 1-phosphate adenylyltransferase
MKCSNYILQKLSTPEQLLHQLAALKLKGKKIVFTNGCFDILHEGHLQSLHTAAEFGHFLIVAVNSDASVKRLKGATRPINNETSRMLMLANLQVVDAVVLFDADTPLQLITTLQPNVLVKGGDYTIETIIGAKEVLANGGTVEIVPIKEGFSTTKIIEKIK